MYILKNIFSYLKSGYIFPENTLLLFSPFFFSSVNSPLTVSLCGLNLLSTPVFQREQNRGQFPFKSTMPLKSIKGYLSKPTRALQ